MKFVVFFVVLVAVVSSYPQSSAVSSRSGPNPRSVGTSTATGNPAATGNPYGPKAYGPGLNNPYAFPPNQFQIQKALALANAQPGLLVRVEINGEVDLTDQYGREVDVYDKFGNDISDLYNL